ncbi:hypothetical protein C8J57DRAFT_1529777 [Mycena rebaudengoi]|nr:hypothetical protein C8J57DRAFT_1529777 [Mycena rebaudengoi]
MVCSRKRKWKRKSKEEHWSNKLWVEGVREELLTPHVEPYADALEHGWWAEQDYIKAVFNEYRTQISWRLADHEEPKLPLPLYNPLAATASQELTEEEEGVRHSRRKELNVHIQRWLKYRDDPYAVLLAQISGVVRLPKVCQAYQQFMHESYDEEIAAMVTARWAAEIKIARELFRELPEEKQNTIRGRAVEEARIAKVAFDKALKDGASKSPEVWQR